MKAKKVRDLALFLILEIASVIWAATVFSVFTSKIVAGALGGAFFLAFSTFMFIKILYWPKFWTAWTLYPLALFLFGSSIPMVWVRFTHLDADFAQLTIVGLSGPEFHRVSTSVLGLLMLVTLAELVKEIFSKAKN